MNYKEEQVAGFSYIRSNQVTISNPINSEPHIHFVEEKVLKVGDSVVCQPLYGATQLVELFNDPSASFPLINPKTGKKIGTVTNADLYAMVHSKYRFLADQRDAKNEHDAQLAREAELAQKATNEEAPS